MKIFDTAETGVVGPHRKSFAGEPGDLLEYGTENASMGNTEEFLSCVFSNEPVEDPGSSFVKITAALTP